MAKHRLLNLGVRNYDTEAIWEILEQADFEDLLFPNIGNLTDSDSRAYGGLVVYNELRALVESYIEAASVTTLNGDVQVLATENATLRASAESNVSSSGGSAFGTGTSLAAGGQIVTNLVLASADAYVLNSTVTTSTSGDVIVTANNTALLDATVNTSSQSGDTAVAFTLAFNSLGWQPQNVLFNAIDALLGDPLISEAFDGEESGARACLH